MASQSHHQSQKSLFSQSQASSLSPAAPGNGMGSFSNQPCAQPQVPSANTFRQTHTNSSSQQPLSGPHPQQSGGVQHTLQNSGARATAPFLEDFSLVAEAAKRAQIAVVMRDLESVTL